MVRLTALVLLVAAACGSINRKDPYDAGDSEPPPPPPPPPLDAAQLHEAREFVSAGARLSSATYRFDVQVGHAVQQGKAAGATYRFQASPAVKP